MGRTLATVLPEELERLTVDADVACLPRDDDVNAQPEWG
jgi:hypothetical protein